MKVIRILAILVSFVIEVRVKAVQQEPNHCISNKNEECTLFSKNTSSIHTQTLKLTMMNGTVLYRSQKKKWNLITGTIRISNQNNSNIKIQTKIGAVILEPGIFWLKWSTDKLWVISLEGTAHLELISNLLKNNILPEGFANWYTLINYKNSNYQGIPRAISLNSISDIIPDIIKHKDRTLVESKESRSISLASNFYHDVVQIGEDYEFKLQNTIENINLNYIKTEKEAEVLFREKHLSPIDLSNSLNEDNN